MKFLKIIMWGLVLFMACVIFSFSSQPAKQSNSVSKGITRKIVDTLPQTKHKTEEQKQKIVNKINHYVRKLAHFSAFFFLGLFLLCAMMLTYSNKYSFLKILVFSAIIALLYAISDEIHQMFVPNRGPQVKDVLIDFSGSALSFFTVLTIKKIISLFKKSQVS
jgi:VanZ family protein